MVIELKRDAVPRIVLNKLFKMTQMQSTFGVIMLALVDGVPKVMSLKEMLQHFIDHRHQVVVLRSEYDLRNAKAREHVLEGLKIAVDNIDEVIEIDPGLVGRGRGGERACASASTSPRCRRRRFWTCGSPASRASRSRSWRPSSQEVRAEIGRLEGSSARASSA